MGNAIKIGLGIVCGLWGAKKVAEYIDECQTVPMSDGAIETAEEIVRLNKRWSELTLRERDVAIGYIERMDKPTIH